MLSTCFVDKVPMLIDTDGIMLALASLIFTTLVWLGWMIYTKFTLTPGCGVAMVTTYVTWVICQFMLDLTAPAAHE